MGRGGGRTVDELERVGTLEGGAAPVADEAGLGGELGAEVFEGGGGGGGGGLGVGLEGEPGEFGDEGHLGRELDGLDEVVLEICVSMFEQLRLGSPAHVFILGKYCPPSKGRDLLSETYCLASTFGVAGGEEKGVGIRQHRGRAGEVEASAFGRESPVARGKGRNLEIWGR